MKERDVEIAREFLKRRTARRREHLQGRLVDARRDFESIVERLVRDFRPLRIYQWGSLLDEQRFSEISDIDIAVEGLNDPLAGLRAAAEAQELTTFPVDLVELERIDPLHAVSIRTKGRLVYERA
ncbi:MAG TPA: nucleotidyltransferase domain-containing protein [Spirochaetia bacterium]|nr:nucleotidyltransferase domain-containing protein [Spirochaetia bacterium]